MALRGGINAPWALAPQSFLHFCACVSVCVCVGGGQNRNPTSIIKLCFKVQSSTTLHTRVHIQSFTHTHTQGLPPFCFKKRRSPRLDSLNTHIRLPEMV